MIRFSFLTVVVGILLIPTIAEADGFEAPKFAPGTEFVIERTNFKYTPVDKFTLSFKGIDADGNYDFDEYIVNKHLAKAKKGEPMIDYQPVKFPLHFGDTWDYSYTGPKNARCGKITRHLHSKVSDSFEKFTVNGAELDVIRIIQNGTWERECDGNNIEGENKFEYLYSPKLGMTVYSDVELRNPRGDVKYNPGSVMKSFNISQ